MLIHTKSWPKPDHAEIVKRSRILVIDDSDFPLLKLFERDGYTIEKWPDVTDLSKLENGSFDLILLDLFGVGLDQSSDQGLGILKHIREVNPAQIVIAYSSADWDVSYQPFFNEADAVLHKTKSDYYEFKRTVDKLLEQRFSPGFYVDRANEELAEYAVSNPKLVKRFKSAILGGDLDTFRAYLSSRVDDEITVDRVIQVAQVAIAAAQLWKT